MLAIVAVTALAVTMSGRFKVDMGVKVKPDLGIDADFRFAVPLGFAEMMDDGDFTDMKGFDDVTVTDVGDMRVMTAKGSLAPGEQLGNAEQQAMPMERKAIQHRLTTRYVVKNEIPVNETMKNAMGAPEEMGDEGPALDMDGMAGLMSGLMSSFKITTTISMPGRIVETNGTLLDANTAEFVLTFDDLSAQEPARMNVVSALPNYAHIGRLADQMILAGGDDEDVARLPEYVRQGLLPDPPMDVVSKYKLGAEDYLALVEIISALNESFSPEIAAGVVQKLGLNKDRVDADYIRNVRTAIGNADLAELAVGKVSAALK